MIDGERLADSSWVWRVGIGSQEGTFSEADFTLSTSDKERPERQWLSVFDCDFTSLEEARAICDKQTPTARLSVLAIRTVAGSLGVAASVDVFRDLLADLEGVPGGDGHCGISGLMRPHSVPKAVYKKLRAKLANLANENVFS